MSPQKNNMIIKQNQEQYIEGEECPWISRKYFHIPKKDRSLQLVQDYRKLNQVTIKDKTSLSLIGEVIDKLKEAKYFNKLDLV